SLAPYTTLFRSGHQEGSPVPVGSRVQGCRQQSCLGSGFESFYSFLVPGGPPWLVTSAPTATTRSRWRPTPTPSGSAGTSPTPAPSAGTARSASESAKRSISTTCRMCRSPGAATPGLLRPTCEVDPYAVPSANSDESEQHRAQAYQPRTHLPPVLRQG